MPLTNFPCTKFDGNGYLTCPTSTSLQTLGAAGSLLLRVNANDVKTGCNLLRSSTGGRVYISSSSKITAPIAGTTATPNLTLTAKAWYDILVTWQYPGNVIAYVCPAGGSDTTDTQTAASSSGAWDVAMTIGAYAAATSILNGSLRDVMLLSRVITAGEWAAYKNGIKPTGSVVADWPLYPDWNDASGNANNLTSGGSKPVVYPAANPPCTRFGGQGYLTCPTSASLQTLGAAGSFLCRMKFNEVLRLQRVIYGATAAQLTLLANGVFRVGANGSSYIYPTGATALDANKWYDVLVTWQHPGTVYAYICPAGGSDSTASSASVAAAAWDAAFYLGNHSSNADYVHGSLRDVMLLSRVITAGEWTAYKAGVKPTGSVVADWPLYPDWLDDSGNANTLTAGGSRPTIYPMPAYEAVEFTGYNYLSCPTSTSLQTLGAAGSFLCRVKFNDTSYHSYIIYHTDTTTLRVYRSYVTNNLSIYVDGSAIVVPNNAILPGVWYDVMVTWAYPGSVTATVCPVGGSDVSDDDPTVASAAFNGSVYLGSTSTPNSYFNGSLRDVMLLSRVITAGEWAAYKAGTLPTGSVVAEWKLNGNYTDSSGNGNNLSPSSYAPVKKPLANYPCVKFDGQGYLTRATSTSLQTLGAAGSLLVRFKTNAAGQAHSFLRSLATTTDFCYISSVTGKFRGWFAGATGAAEPNLVVQPSTWYDALVTWAYPGNVTAYICPVGGSDTTASIAAGAAGTWTDAVILGAYATSMSSPLCGSLRDVMLLSRVITAGEWAAYKNGTKPIGSVVAQWDLAKDYLDSSGNANHLAPAGSTPSFSIKKVREGGRFSRLSYLARAATDSTKTLGAAGSFITRVKLNTVGVTQYLIQALATNANLRILMNSGTGRIYVGAGSSATEASPTKVMLPNTWYNVLATWAVPGNINVYIASDGETDSTASVATVSSGSWDTTIYVGYATTSGLEGGMKDTMLLSRVITAAEWAAYKAGKKPTGSVVADWPLYPDFKDYSGNANDLTAGGTILPVADRWL